jgi:gliding motility-associated-like protein
MRFSIFTFLLFILMVQVHAQTITDVTDDCQYIPPRQANTWYFYLNAGLEFNTAVSSLSNVQNLNDGMTKTAVSVLCDEDGKLLLYSNGVKVWNSNFSELSYAHTGKLLGSDDCSQSSLFIPNADTNSPFCYLFTVDVLDPFPTPYSTDGLRYSIINLQTGNVDFPNILLKAKAAEKLTGTRHANGVDFWAIAHGYEVDGGESNAFFAYLVSDSVHSSPVTSHVGTPHDGLPSDQNSYGYMKASPDGSKIALAIFGKNMVELFDFNNTTGVVGSQFSHSSPEVEDAFCVEFSPDGSKLYVSTYVPISAQYRSYIYQYDLSALPSYPFDQHETIFYSDTSVYGGMQLGPDGKIYISSISRDGETRYKFLSVIENPNRPGADCNFRENGIQLNVADKMGSYRGLVNVNQAFIDLPHFTYLNHCHYDSTYFDIWNKANTDRWFWDFGAGKTSTDENPYYVFPSPGKHQVSVTEYLNNKPFTNTESVIIYPLPFVDLGNGEDTIFKYPGSDFKLDAGPGYDFYYWNGSDQPGGQTFVATDTGMYYVMVVDSNCCYNVDRVWIYESRIIIPNAFTPNGDGHNETFRPLVLTEGVTNFSMLIYNRWGQLIFESKDYTTGWDGQVKNKYAPPGVYIYVISYNVRTGVESFKSEVSKGHVTLLR